jgi:SAM-dependent methyltransferase
VCGSSGLALERPSTIRGAIDSNDFAITDNRYGVTDALYRCPSCQFLQCTDLGNVLGFYEDLEDPSYDEGRPQRVIQARRLLEIVKRHKLSGRLVDIGAGTGILVEEAGKTGYLAEGVEPSRWLQRRAVERRLQVHLGTYPHADVHSGFNIVTIVDVIEHIPNPTGLLQEVAKQLAEDGIGLVVTPDVGSLAARLMGARWWHFRIAHIGYFGRKNLLLALDKAGLAPIAIGRPGWYFSLDYLIERVNWYMPRWFQLPVMRFMKGITVPLNLGDSLYVVFKKAASR